jgi:hypothetical protein
LKIETNAKIGMPALPRTGIPRPPAGGSAQGQQTRLIAARPSNVQQSLREVGKSQVHHQTKRGAIPETLGGWLCPKLEIQKWAARWLARPSTKPDANEAQRLMSIAIYWEKLAVVEEWHSQHERHNASQVPPQSDCRSKEHWKSKEVHSARPVTRRL